MLSSPIRVGSRLPLLMLVVATPLVFWGAIAVPSNTADIAQWLPDGSEARQKYGEFVETFGADNFVLVSWPGCSLEDERLDQFASALLARGSDPDSVDGAVIRRVITARQFLADLTGPPLNLSPESAIRRIQGLLIGADGKACAMLIQPASGQRADQHAIVDMVFEEAPNCGLEADALRVGGTAYKAVMIERESDRTLRLYGFPSCLVALLVAAICLRNSFLTVAVLTAAVFAELLSLALVYYSGGQLNAVMIVMPPLIFVLTVSSGIHLINYYRDGMRDREIDCAASHALRIGWLPITLASVTTAIGLISLSVSAISPVRLFGVYSGAALMSATVVVLVVLPNALAFLASQKHRRTPSENRRELARHSVNHRRNNRVAEWVCRHPRAILATCLFVLVAFGGGLWRLEASVKLERSFAESSRFVRDYKWIEQNIGPLLAMEVLISFNDSCELKTIERMELMTRVHATVRQMETTGGVLSPVTLSPALPRGRGIRQAARRNVVAKRFDEGKPALVEQGLMARLDGREVWRLSARVPAMGDLDYQAIQADLSGQVEAVLADVADDGIDITYTGLSPLINRAQSQLLEDLLKSFLLALLIICPVMMLVLRSVLGGIVAMIPNVVPIICVFGALGWLGVRIDIGAVLTASVSLGIAVDGTLHFLTWYARGLRNGLERPAAVRAAYQRCASAMIQTTLICGLGILVFSLSSYTPASRFGWLIAVLLTTALVSDLLLLPALLASPLGKVFEPQQFDRLRSFVRRDEAHAEHC